MKKDLEDKRLDKGRPGEAPVQILVVDDNLEVRSSLAEFLLAEGHRVETAGDGLQAMEMLAARRYHLVVTAVNLAGTNVLEWLWTILQQYPQTVVLVVTDYGSMRRAAKAVKMGAFEYLVKPIVDDELRVTIQRALQQQALLSGNDLVRRERALRASLDGGDRWRHRQQSASLRRRPGGRIPSN